MMTKVLKLSFSSCKGSTHKPLVVSGCSGSGKSTLINYLTSWYSQLFKLNPSHTTRAPRKQEVNEHHYCFISPEQFQTNVAHNKYIEHFEVHNNMYGTHMQTMNAIINEVRVCVLDLDLQGGQKVNKLFPQWNYLFILCNSLQTLRNRLENRETDSKQVIQLRVNNAQRQLQLVKQLKYYQVLENEDINQAQKELINYINRKYQFNLEIKNQINTI